MTTARFTDADLDEIDRWATNARWSTGLRALIDELRQTRPELERLRAVADAAEAFISFSYRDQLPIDGPKSKMVTLANDLHHALAALHADKEGGVNEGDLQEAVIELAHLFKWRVAHFRAAKTDKGWRTPVAADGAGFPDLVLVRPGSVMFVELKSAVGKLSPWQAVWCDALVDAGVDFRLWRPEHWESGAIEKQLRETGKGR